MVSTGREHRASQTVLVTGAHGFVGARITQRLLDLGYKVRGLVRRDDPIEGVELVVGDIADPSAARRAVEGAHAVIHSAAYFQDDFDEAVRVNVEGTRNLASAALESGANRFVHISTCGVYDLVGVDVVTESTPLWAYEPTDTLTYGVTKAQAERVVREAGERGLPAVILRPPNVLGADVLNSWSYHIALRLAEGKLAIGGSGDNTWPYVHVENLIDVITSALTHPAATGEAFTVVDGHTTWGAYVGIFADWLHVTPGRRELREPYDSFRGRFSTEKVQQVLGYTTRHTFESAMKETRAFLIEQGVIAQ